MKFNIRDKKERKIMALKEYKSQIDGLKRSIPLEKFTEDYEIFYEFKKTSIHEKE